MFTNETGKFAKKHKEKLHHFDDVEAIQLLDSSELVRRLARREKPFELLKWSLKADHSEVHHKHY